MVYVIFNILSVEFIFQKHFSSNFGNPYFGVLKIKGKLFSKKREKNFEKEKKVKKFD